MEYRSQWKIIKNKILQNKWYLEQRELEVQVSRTQTIDLK